MNKPDTETGRKIKRRKINRRRRKGKRRRRWKREKEKKEEEEEEEVLCTGYFSQLDLSYNNLCRRNLN